MAWSLSQAATPKSSRILSSQTSTIGRGTDIVCLAIENLAAPLKGRTVKSLTENWGVTWRYLVSDSQLRRTGPEKGAIYLTLGAVVNALWDLRAK